MPDAVCCPKCWIWDELGKRTTCKHCGTPLILADGRTVSEAAAHPGSVPLVPAFAATGPAVPTTRVMKRGIDWVDVARLITIGYGLLIILALITLGLLSRLNVPITDPNTGQTVVRTINPGPIFAILAIMAAGGFALVTWLTKFAVARIIFLVIDGLTVVTALSRLSSGTDSLGLLTVVNLILCFAYGAALVLSFVSPRSA